MAFDVTIVEMLRRESGGIGLGNFALLEVQTMDFHGTYSGAVSKLRNALDLHPQNFAAVLQENLWWAGDGIEGPNISNVFKRTFYQMAFKFRFAEGAQCAGTALVIPDSVWDSWQPFLAAPTLHALPDGCSVLAAPGQASQSEGIPAWIHVVQPNAESPISPNPIVQLKTIGVTADALTHYALRAAPEAASEELLSAGGIYASLQRRLRAYWRSARFDPASS